MTGQTEGREKRISCGRRLFCAISKRWATGGAAGHPAFRRKHHRQSIRLTRNGFALHGGRLYVAKVGDIRVEWSRSLPSAPSSVTVIREPDGRYYASFVVERPATPLPACDREVGLDLRLYVSGASERRLVAVSASGVLKPHESASTSGFHPSWHHRGRPRDPRGNVRDYRRCRG
jgi:hypothetical protein